MIIVFSNVLNDEYSAVKYSTGDNVTVKLSLKVDLEDYFSIIFLFQFLSTVKLSKYF